MKIFNEKIIRLKDNQEVALRLVTERDKKPLLDFFVNLPREDRSFLKEDVTDPTVVERWLKELDYARVLPLVAIYNEKIVGDASLHCQKLGWSRHVGEIRCVVTREFQQKGLGTLMATELFRYAVSVGIQKIIAEMMDSQISAIKAFQRIGFEKEATLSNHVMDLKGNKHNLIIMALDANKLLDKMEDLILDTEVYKQ